MRWTTKLAGLAAAVGAADAFTAPIGAGRALLGTAVASRADVPGTRQGPTMAIKALAKKAKEAAMAKALEELRASTPDSPVFQYMEQGEAGPAEDSPAVLAEVLSRSAGTLSVVAEYRRNIVSGFVDGILEPNLLGPMFREGGAGCVAIDMDKTTGGCSVEDVNKLVAEQATAAGDFPGPLPIIVTDLVVTEFQVARAKAFGAAGVTLQVGLVGEERCRELLEYARRLGLESVVQATSEEEIGEASAAGANIVVLVGKPATEAAELCSKFPEGVVPCATVDRRSDEGMLEIEECWALRDAGYKAVWVSEVLYKSGQEQAQSVMAILRAIRAKASAKYGVARGMSGKGEGAKEYLGTLAS